MLKKVICRRRITYLAVLLISVWAVGGFACCSAAQSEDLSLKVALFPYLADPEGFQEAVRDSWGQRHPDVELHFTDWNCYHSDPVEGIS